MPVEKLEFNQEESEKLRKIAGYYRIAKELIIYGEQIDPKHRTLAQTLSERANAFDHLMRIILEKHGMRDETETVEDPIAYNRANLDKTYGHIYRAAYDALDWVALTIQERMANDMNCVSLDTINVVIPQYFTEIKPELEGIIRNDITRIRNEKDVGIDSEVNLQQLIKTVGQLKKYFDQVERSMPSLLEYERRNKHKQRMDTVRQILIGISLVVIGWILGHFIK